jgi:nucleoside-diphosphate kinase
MAIERTYAMIKPDAYSKGHMGEIISMIEQKGFKIIHARLFKFTDISASQFYDVHQGKPFFDGLIEFMTSDKVMGLVLERENAVKEWRDLMGATNPADAAPDSIRGKFGGGMPDNATHGSDSVQNAKKEITYLFGEFASIPSTEKKLAKEY